MPVLKHFHTYERSKKNKRIYRCAHPDCSHFTDVENLRGKRAKCKCGVDFILEQAINDKHFKRKELKCDICLNAKPVKMSPAVQSILDEALAPRMEVIPKNETQLALEEPLDTFEEESDFEIEEDD